MCFLVQCFIGELASREVLCLSILTVILDPSVTATWQVITNAIDYFNASSKPSWCDSIYLLKWGAK
ncbi:hypothetical protein AZF00_10400 [Zhongshania aliphaticivorans]|uniref:Uncharacterized protein n=1 Tax=Zhongshania aliphaticivorans TaxID=1470434 RepID=A0A127M648_9GAMM|nr:hypothetical protein AZF00_10400 [Zhongshania aliphaticivorans]